MDGRPNLLLHNLGDSHKKADAIFTEAKVVLCNTSGSGKTRVLLDGLSNRWGFYLTAEPSLDHIGSSDLGYMIDRMSGKAGWASGVFDGVSNRRVTQSKSQTNEKIAKLGVSRILFARWSILKVFLEVAKQVHGSLPPNIKESWLLFQILSPTSDVFRQFIDSCLAGVDTDQQIPRIHLFDDESTLFYYVLDQIQEAEHALMGCFSDSSGLQRGSLLLPLVQRLLDDNHHVILSGVSFSLDHLPTATTSQVQWHIHHQMDDLSDPNRQEAYIRRYLPETFLASDVGRELVKRMWESCRGRPIFTTAVLEKLMIGEWHTYGPSSPMTVLNAYSSLKVKLEIGFHNWFILQEPLIVDDDQGLAETSLGRFTLVTNEQKHPKSSIIIDEPLALVSICHRLIEKRFLPSFVWNRMESENGKGPEGLTLVALIRLFQNEINLGYLFNFAKDPSQWFLLKAQIISKTAKGYIEYQGTLHEVDRQVPPFRAQNPDDVTNWLTSNSSPAWCIPDPMMGPDLMTRVKLSNGDIVLVVVWVKYWEFGASKDESLQAEDTATVIRSLTPSEWFSNTRARSATTIEEGQVKAMLSEVNKLNLLRVIVTRSSGFWLDLDSQEVRSSVAADEHPLATIGLLHIAQAFSEATRSHESVHGLKVEQVNDALESP
ncbi:hypothetical protein PIIN_09346 [Serendipita indica DSM 11827]|uniref:Uncharacterized protein n=1 Tax=Serendipita indica (strain DSM 11827) TaxID=1109443 RepID=G4TVL9_SERID|nr:hypothetical protein PIIN_09346 [Serendipita indica DSM 11827]